jgi:hypothetical protein
LFFSVRLTIPKLIIFDLIRTTVEFIGKIFADDQQKLFEKNRIQKGQ